MAFNPRITIYDSSEVVIIFAGLAPAGFADGEFVTCARNEPSFELTVGADGEATRSKTNNRSGQVTLNLLQGSNANDALSLLANLDENSPNGDGIGPFLLKDNSGRTVISAQNAWIRQRPEVSFGRTADASREWILETSGLVFDNIGGNPIA